MERLQLAGAELEIRAEGRGRPVLFLHGEDYYDQQRPFLDMLASSFRLIAPRHPGFGASTLPSDFRSVADLAYLYLDLIEDMKLESPIIVGSSLGGWIALEMAVRAPATLGRLVLIGTVGAKIGSRDERDFADIFQIPEHEARNLTFADPDRFAPTYSALPDEALATIARDRQSAVHFTWRPYMHNPALRKWLHRVRVPTLVVWGADDGVATVDYARKLTGELPQAELKIIADAGHYPHIERAEAVAGAIRAFVKA